MRVNREDLKYKYGKEMVYVVPTEDVPALTDGLTTRSEVVIPRLLENGIYGLRSEVEFNPIVKQIIPYAVLKSGDKVFTMNRLKGSGEQRLVGNTSVGVGGHINPIDEEDKENSHYDNLFMSALMREVNEEVYLKSKIKKVEYVGIIQDTSNEVGLDHLGLLYILDLKSPDATIKEKDVLAGEWKSIKEISKDDTLEKWSKIAISHLNRGEAHEN